MPRTFLAILTGGALLLSEFAFGQTPDGELPNPASEGVKACRGDETSQGLFGESPCSLPRWSVTPEYLLWQLREGRAPALLTTGPAASQGVLGTPGTSVLYGDDRLQTRHGDRFNGIRLNAAYWFDDQQNLGIEGSIFFLERDSTYFKATSAGDVLLARPYLDALTGNQASQVIAGPGPSGNLAGGFVGYSRIELFSQEANLVATMAEFSQFRLEFLAGARFLQMRDRADFTSSGRLLPAQTTLLGTEDHFRTHDFFYGGQVGLRGQYNVGRWFVNIRGSAALGGNAEQVRAFGDHLFQTPTQRTDLPGGLLVQASNTGTFGRTALNAVYEVRVNLGYQVTSWCRAFVGYTFLFWDSPIRAVDQVDLALGGSRPTIPFREDFFWAQGVNAGMQFTW